MNPLRNSFLPFILFISLLPLTDTQTQPTCPAGYSCEGGKEIACSPGEYSVSGKCIKCPAGSKCPNMSGSPIPCSPGEYSEKDST